MSDIRYRATLVWVGALCAGALAFPALGASFDCAKASTKVEHLVCSDPYISSLDSKLAVDYRKVLSKASDKERREVAKNQMHWLRFMRNACATKTCLKEAYWEREAALETYFEPRSPLYAHESDKAEEIRNVLATSPLYPLYKTPFCAQVFDDLKKMNGIRFIDPVVQTDSYEDPVLDPWKRKCQAAPAFNVTYQCDRNIIPADADDVVDACNVGYGLPPFKLFQVPSATDPARKIYIFYTDDAYGPMNRDFRKPFLGGGFAGFQQIDPDRCLSVLGNQWLPGRAAEAPLPPVFADAGQGGRDGKNYNSIIQYKAGYYFLVLHISNGSYRMDISSIAPNGSKAKKVCNWFPTKQ